MDYYYYGSASSLTTASVFYMMYLAVILGYYVVAYIFTSKGIYTVAQRRGIKNPWLAWVPVGNCWILGSISDQYRYVTRGQVSNRRKILLWLCAVSTGAAVLLLVMCVYMAFAADYYGSTVSAGGLLGVILLYFLMLGAAITETVFYYMSLYDYYASCRPDQKILFLLLSIFVGAPMPFFIFACRNDDLGMPPRNDRQMPPPQPFWPNQPPRIPGQF